MLKREPVLRQWEPVRLARRDEAMVRAANFILQRAHALPFSWGGRPWSLTLLPADAVGGMPPRRADLGTTWCLDLLWGDAPFRLGVTGQAALAWLSNAYPDLDLPELPDLFVGAFLEAAGRAWLAPLSGLGRGELRVVRIEKAGDDTYRQEEAWCLQLKSEAEGSQAPIEAWFTTTRKGVAHLTACLQDWSPAPGPLGPESLPVVLRAEVGFTWMTAAEWGTLNPGDAILVERPLLAPDGEMVLTAGPLALRARPDQGRLVVTANWPIRPQGERLMDSDEYDDSEGSPLDELRQVPLRVAFDVGEVHLTVAELESLQVGQALDLGRPLSEAVQVRINGTRVGWGELIDISGRLGVVLRALGNMSLEDLPLSHETEQGDSVDGENDLSPALQPEDLKETTDAAEFGELPDFPPPEA